ncbi:hypothetical protein K6E05_003328 [Salmonella enterica]|nr:hypothetical protein [Salmonella enterica]
MQRRYTGGARIFIYCCFFVCLLTAGAGVIQLTGMAEPSRSGRVFGVVRPPAVSGYIRCRYERPVATLESDALAQGVAGMRVSAVCLLRDRAGNWRVYRGEMPVTENPASALTAPLAGGSQAGAAWTEGR